MSLSVRRAAVVALSLVGVAVLIANGLADQSGAAAAAVLNGGIWD
jgi:hypothetical protein